MTFAYADPPYVGQAKKHYGSAAREVNHRLLIAYLQTFDGWALSLSSPSLQAILPLCPPNVRIMAWVKPFCIYKPNVNPAYAWEPIIVKPARSLGRGVQTQRDWVSANITLRRGLTGVKPDAFCVWLFEMFGIREGDEFFDLFPGSGAVSAAYSKWRDTL